MLIIMSCITLLIKHRDDKEIVVDKYEINYKNFKDFITLNHYNGRKNDNITLR